MNKRFPEKEEDIQRYEVIRDGNILCFADFLFCVAFWLYEGQDVLQGHILRMPDDTRNISDEDISKILAGIFAHFAPQFPREFQAVNQMLLSTQQQEAITLN